VDINRLENRNAEANILFGTTYTGCADPDRPDVGHFIKVRVEQAACVTGPLHPILYRHQPCRWPSSPNSFVKRPASKWARRGQWS